MLRSIIGLALFFFVPFACLRCPSRTHRSLSSAVFYTTVAVWGSEDEELLFSWGCCIYMCLFSAHSCAEAHSFLLLYCRNGADSSYHGKFMCSNWEKESLSRRLDFSFVQESLSASFSLQLMCFVYVVLHNLVQCMGLFVDGVEH